MGDKPVYYIDACVFIWLIETPHGDEPAMTISAMLDDARKGKCRIVTSVITITEVAFAKYELDNRVLDPEVEKKIDRLWHPGSMVKIAEVHEIIAKRARDLLRVNVTRGWSKTRAHDAIHLATAEREGVDEFFTYSRDMKKWEEEMPYAISEPHEASETVEDGQSLFVKNPNDDDRDGDEPEA